MQPTPERVRSILRRLPALPGVADDDPDRLHMARVCAREARHVLAALDEMYGSDSSGMMTRSTMSLEIIKRALPVLEGRSLVMALRHLLELPGERGQALFDGLTGMRPIGQAWLIEVPSATDVHLLMESPERRAREAGLRLLGQGAAG